MEPSIPAQPITIQVRLHAILRNLKQVESMEGIRLTLPVDATIAEVIQVLALPKMEMVYSLNAKMVGEETVLHAGDELDIIPAISGGSVPGTHPSGE